MIAQTQARLHIQSPSPPTAKRRRPLERRQAIRVRIRSQSDGQASPPSKYLVARRLRHQTLHLATVILVQMHK